MSSPKKWAADGAVPMESYRDRVEKLARDRDGKPIYNGSLDHAEIIVENMFAHAKSDVCILTGHLNARVYGPAPVMEQARLFLSNPQHTVKLLIEEPEKIEWKEHPFLHEFSDNENVEIRKIPKNLQDSYDFHFLVMDDDSYRYEGDKTKYSAIAAFGDKKGAANIREIFNVLWAKGISISAPAITE